MTHENERRTVAGEKIRLDSGLLSPKGKELFAFLQGKVRGQDRAVEKFAHAFEIVRAEIRPKHRPVLKLLFLGPSGVGKSLMPSALAEYLFKDRFGYTQINCANYPAANSHAISLLQGAPPGYIGFLDAEKHSESEILLHQYPVLSQWNIDKHHVYALYEDQLKSTQEEINKKSKELAKLQGTFNVFKKNKKDKTTEGKLFADAIKDLQAEIKQLQDSLNVYKTDDQYTSIVNFDEIEQGSHELHKIISDILEEGKLGLKDGRVTSFYNSIITATSNIGSRDMLQDLKGERFGFATSLSQLSVEDANLYDKIKSTAIEELKKFFGDPALLNRFDDLIVFSPLSRATIEAIFDLEFGYLLKELEDAEWIVEIILAPEVKKFVVDKSVSRVEYGARELKRKIDRYLRRPLASLRTTFQLVDGETLYVSVENGKLVFDKDTS